MEIKGTEWILPAYLNSSLSFEGLNKQDMRYKSRIEKNRNLIVLHVDGDVREANFSKGDISWKANFPLGTRRGR